MSLRLRALVAACALPSLLAIDSACSSTTAEPEPPSIPCAASEIALGMERAADVHVFVDDALPERVRGDLRDYLARMWKAPVSVAPGVPAGQPGDAIWISSSAEAKTRARGGDDGFALVRADEGGRKVIAAYAAKPEDLVAASYALLEELGARFFHPMQELVPELDAPYFPRALDAHRKPFVKTRGIQVHLLHPLEYLKTLDEPSEESFAEARRLVDWLVKTGQNHLQWPLLGAQVPWGPFAEHARRIAAYAHGRGVTIGAMVQLHHKAALQRNYVLVRDDAKFKAEIEAGLTRLMEVPWDDVEIGMGEFLTTDPEALLTWLNAAVSHMGNIAPKTHVAVQNHIGNYPHLYVDFRGERSFFYHLPRHADPRLGQTVHTLFWFDLYRDGGMYQHTDFAFQRDYMFSQLDEHRGERRVRYFPESAYWIATDIDVPAFLPEFVESRWTDIHRLAADTKTKNLPPLDGHVMFSSGHEWGFWLTDYLAAKMMWEPEAPLERFFSHYTSAYGSCAPAIGQDLARYVALQRTYLFEKGLIAYISGEDNAVDLGALAGFEIRKLRKKFDVLVTGSEGDRVAFESTVLADLELLVREIRPLEDNVAARCRGSDATLRPWCDELRDGMRIVRVRLEHSLLLYRAVLAHARGNGGEAARLLADGMAKTEQAKEVITEREKGYRFPVERLTGGYENVTNYAFGYLRQPHTQCLWRRQDEQARRIVEENLIGSAPTGLASCLD